MRKLFMDQSLAGLRFQRNAFLALSLFLAVSGALMSCFLFSKHDRIVVTTPVIEKSFWLDGNTVSPTYLEQFGIFVGQLVLSKSPTSARTHREMLLRCTDERYVPLLRERLFEEEEKLKKQGGTLQFFPQDVCVDQANLEVRISGENAMYVGGREISRKKEGYKFQFSYAGGMLKLKGILSDVQAGS